MRRGRRSAGDLLKVTPEQLERMGYELMSDMCRQQNEMFEPIRGLLRGHENLAELLGAFLSGFGRAMREDTPDAPVEMMLDGWINIIPIPPQMPVSREDIKRACLAHLRGNPS